MSGHCNRYWISCNSDDVRRVLGRSGQRSVKAIVVSLVDGLAQRNSCILKRANVVGVIHQYCRSLGEGEQLASERALESNTSRRVVQRLPEHKRSQVHHPDCIQSNQQQGDRLHQSLRKWLRLTPSAFQPLDSEQRKKSQGRQHLCPVTRVVKGEGAPQRGRK